MSNHPRGVGRPPIPEKDRLVTVYTGIPLKDLEKLEEVAKRYRLVRSQLIAFWIGQKLDEEYYV
jgi:flagellar basal body-associated protein FliL